MENKREELKGILREILTEEKDQAGIEAKEAAYQKLLEENKALKEAEAKRIASPGKIVSLDTPEGKTVDFIYKGYDLKRQCKDLTIKDESTRESIAKFTIDMITKASLSEANTGAYLVPDEYENTLMALARLESLALQKCRIFNISRDVLKIPVEATGTSVNAAAFGTANGESDPTLGLKTLDMKRIGNYTEIFNDLLEDSVFDITSYLASMNAEAIGQSIDNNVFGSTGTSFTGNILTDAGSFATVGTSASTIANVSYTHFSECISKLASNKIQGAEWYINRLGLHYVRILTDESDRLIYMMPSGTQPGGIYGFPVNSVEVITGAPATTKPFVLFGNLKNYALGIRKGMTMQMNPYIKMKEGITQFVCHTRVDGDALFDSAFAVIKIG